MSLNRRSFMKSPALLVALAACRRTREAPRAPATQLRAEQLTTLGAIAETLVPTDETPGAEAGPAQAFIIRRIKTQPGLLAPFSEVADEVEAAALRNHAKPYAALVPTAREALLRTIFPSLNDTPMLDPVRRSHLVVLRQLMHSMFIADALGLEDVAYQRVTTRRDPRNPSTLSFERGLAIPDVLLERQNAMMVGTGVYQRAWAAAGFEQPRGVCKSEDVIKRRPSWDRG